MGASGNGVSVFYSEDRAFFGLGVTPVYAAFELLSEELARRLSGKRQADQG